MEAMGLAYDGWARVDTTRVKRKRQDEMHEHTTIMEPNAARLVRQHDRWRKDSYGSSFAHAHLPTHTKGLCRSPTPTSAHAYAHTHTHTHTHTGILSVTRHVSVVGSGVGGGEGAGGELTWSWRRERASTYDGEVKWAADTGFWIGMNHRAQASPVPRGGRQGLVVALELRCVRAGDDSDDLSGAGMDIGGVLRITSSQLIVASSKPDAHVRVRASAQAWVRGCVGACVLCGREGVTHRSNV